MNDRFDFIFFKYLFDRGFVQQIVFIKARTLACDLLNPIDHAFAGIDQVVDDDNVVAGVDQFHRCVAADEAGAACD